MALENLKQYKISIKPDANKTQGLRTGDIVRRQYFDGKNIVYSLMCVMDYGVDKVQIEQTVKDNNGNIILLEDGTPKTELVTKDSPYFVGALLDGDVPKSGEILDFARMTSLFDTNRSGAVYLTASDDEAPFMDIIDGIGRNCSLCWPENIAQEGYVDPASQYVAIGLENLEVNYIASQEDYYRICHIKRMGVDSDVTIGLKQDFYQYVSHPNQVLISYRIKSSANLSLEASLGYADGTKFDNDPDETKGPIQIASTTQWTYHVHAVTIEFSGRHLRSFQLNLQNMGLNDEVWISDFNIILLSSISNFQEASQIRVGKLTGINDKVFGKLDNYGGYFQKLFAANSVHISGTLTAGDENGFGATFYAGKIHKNAFLNSLQPHQVSGAEAAIDEELINPTGIGKVYVSDSPFTLIAQSNEWLFEHIGKKYCFSFWGYAKCETLINIVQNQKVVGSITIPKSLTHGWHRFHSVFDILAPVEDTADLEITLSTVFTVDTEDEEDESLLYFSAPQLESGSQVTQYQPTDDSLNFTDSYGAWFSQGGIGGTIQNPLLRLNPDGSIASRSNSFRINTEGDGHIANGQIAWDKVGKVTFGDGVTLNWNNIGESLRQELQNKSIKIIGADTFTLLGDESGSDLAFSPSSIVLTMEEVNLTTSSAQRRWYYLYNNEYIPLPNANGKTFTVLPDASYWGKDNTLTIKCVVTYNENIYTDSITLKKQYIAGYSVEITSVQGNLFKNGQCRTVLNANVYYQGKLVSPTFVEENFMFQWHMYHLPDIDNEVQDWWEAQYDDNNNLIQEAIDRTKSSITLGYNITGNDLFVCELVNGGAFPYSFPAIF